MSEHQLVHEGTAVEEFYAALPRPVTVGIESTGYAVWFHTLMQRCEHTLLVGDAAQIRAMAVRKTKTDRRAARLILDLLRHDRLIGVCHSQAWKAGCRSVGRVDAIDQIPAGGISE